MTETQFTMVTERIFHPDGAVEINTSDSFDGRSSMTTAMLNETDLIDLTFMVNGKDLRPLLDDPAVCEVVEDYELKVSLELDSGTLAKELAGCLTPGESHPTLDELLDLARRY